MKVYIVAGEPSGDLLAYGLMRALLRRKSVIFKGIGGESMATVETSRGSFNSLFDISEISVMGFFEILPRLPLILKRIKQTVNDIEAFSPDVLVTVDSWGFVSALITRLRKRWRRTVSRHGNVVSRFPIVHYVAPQVWAWKKGRAKNVARLVDRLMTLMPDECKYFEKFGLKCDFVGHPVTERILQSALNPVIFRQENGIPADAMVISVLPGSRYSEAKRLIPILKKAIERVAANSPESIFVVVPTVAGVEDEVRRGFEGFSIPTCVVTGEINRYNAFATSNLAISKSGTVSLELVALGVPHAIVYTFGRLSNFVAKMLVKVRFANLINILADREIIPEFVLANCRPEFIADCATRLLTCLNIAEQQVTEAREVMQRLKLPYAIPSDRAAEIVIEETS